jgi:UDP-GlcNAc:undecaprenyl-phosphate GlcNAc-1-phosphate transferase
MMASLITLGLVAMLLSLAITPACRWLCKRLGWVDHPNARKVHHTPIPRGGGIAIFLSYVAALMFSPHDARMQALLPAIAIVFATGLLDDIAGLKPWMKIAGSLTAAILACQAGIQLSSFGGMPIGPGWLQIALTVFWLIGCTNAFNLIDGLDGLAAGIGLFATLAALLSGLISGNYALAILAAPLLGSLLGFLPYNFSPASIFLGDSGSFSIGFLLGCFAIVWWQSTATIIGMAAPLIALAIPVLDTAFAILRRLGRGQPVFRADREHIHHVLLARGYTPKAAACMLYAVAGILAGLAILLSNAPGAPSLGGLLSPHGCCVSRGAVRHSSLLPGAD